MRGIVPDLPSPHPLAATLPALLRDDPFAVGLCDSFDDLLAPAILVLDTFGDYLDPDTVPDDMLPWLAQWLGVNPDLADGWHIQRDELLLTRSLNQIRGTRWSIQATLENAVGAQVDVTESGGARWTATPGGDLPGEPEPSIGVVIHQANPEAVDLERVEQLIRSLKPAHVRHSVSVVP
ncbi:MAG: phage tail protein [Arachnia sp.]